MLLFVCYSQNLWDVTQCGCIPADRRTDWKCFCANVRRCCTLLGILLSLSLSLSVPRTLPSVFITLQINQSSSYISTASYIDLIEHIVDKVLRKTHREHSSFLPSSV